MSFYTKFYHDTVWRKICTDIGMLFMRMYCEYWELNCLSSDNLKNVCLLDKSHFVICIVICVVCGLFICSLLTRVQVICDIIFSDFLICLNVYVMLMWTRDIIND